MRRWLNDHVLWRFMSLDRAVGRTRRAYDRLRREGRIPGKHCRRCGGELEDARFQNCRACRASGRKSYAKLRQHRLAEGSCINCGGKREDPVHMNCLRCRKQGAKRVNMHDARWKGRKGDSGRRKAKMAPAKA